MDAAANLLRHQPPEQAAPEAPRLRLLPARPRLDAPFANDAGDVDAIPWDEPERASAQEDFGGLDDAPSSSRASRRRPRRFPIGTLVRFDYVEVPVYGGGQDAPGKIRVGERGLGPPIAAKEAKQLGLIAFDGSRALGRYRQLGYPAVSSREEALRVLWDKGVSHEAQARDLRMHLRGGSVPVEWSEDGRAVLFKGERITWREMLAIPAVLLLPCTREALDRADEALYPYETRVEDIAPRLKALEMLRDNSVSPFLPSDLGLHEPVKPKAQPPPQSEEEAQHAARVLSAFGIELEDQKAEQHRPARPDNQLEPAKEPRAMQQEADQVEHHAGEDKTRKAKKRRRPSRWRNGAWREPFLAKLRKGFRVADACHAISLTASAAYSNRNSDPDFAAEWARALEEGKRVRAREWAGGMPPEPEAVAPLPDGHNPPPLADTRKTLPPPSTTYRAEDEHAVDTESGQVPPPEDRDRKAADDPEDWRSAFLSAIEEGKTVALAADIVGVDVGEAYRARLADSDFTKRWAEARSLGRMRRADDLEDQAFAALDGTVLQLQLGASGDAVLSFQSRTK